MARDHKRADGSVIDPTKDLEEYLQSFPSTGAPDPPEPKPRKVEPPVQTAPEPTPVAPPPEPPAEPTAEERLAAIQRERDDYRGQLEQERQRRAQQEQIDAAAQRAVLQQQQSLQRPPAQVAPQPDPRLQQIDDLWFTDPPAARRLQEELLSERFERTFEQKFTQKDIQRQQEFQKTQGRVAYDAAMAALRASGVPETELDDPDRITALYTIVTRPPTAQMPNPYFDAGGPLSTDVLLKAARKVFTFGGAAPQPVVGNYPAPASVPQMIPATPPGSGRPSAAVAAPSQGRATPISAEMRRDLTRMAEDQGLDPEKLIERHRRRMAAEKER